MGIDAANAADPTFETLLAEVMTAAHRFGHRRHFDAPAGVDALVDLNPGLLDKRLLTRFYRPATLAAQRAKGGWVEPDLAPFPWQRVTSRDPRADQWRWRPSSRNRFFRPGMQTAARFRRRLGRSSALKMRPRRNRRGGVAALSGD